VITVSHSAPYETDTPADAIALINAWVADTNVDMLSPQLYSSGTEPAPDYAETSACKSAGCTWDLYKNSKAKFVPSIVNSNQYDAVKSYFASTHSITVTGYIQW